MQELRANTQVIVPIGPFVDVTDGFTPETGVTLSGADEAEILKHGSTTVVDISAATWAAITGMDGYYGLTITTALADTEGLLTVVVQDDSVCLPVKQEFMVLSQAAWDSKYAAKDTGYMSVDPVAWNGTALSTTDTLSDWDDGGRLDLLLDAIKVVTDALPNSGALTDLATATNLATVDTVVDAIKVVTDALTAAAAAKLALSAGTIVSGTATAGTLSTTQMEASGLTEATDNHYNGRILIWTSGVLQDQATNITDYDGATKTFTFTAVTEAPGAGDTFVIV